MASMRLLEAAQRLGGQVHSLELDGLGPAGETLAIQIAVVGASEPRRALIHTSGLHEVEGFPGSAIRLRVMASLTPPPDSGDAIVLFEEFLVPMELSQNALARGVGVPPRRINEIVQ